MRVLLMLALLVMGCGGSTEPGMIGPGLIDRVRSLDARTLYSVGSQYVVADHWAAYDSLGRQVALDPVRIAVGDSTNIETPVDGAIVFTEVSNGPLFLYAPTRRNPLELLARHAITVTGP
jgi:hypothetical protein